jgi:hypothetical protein
MPTVKVIPGKLNYVMTRGDDFAAQLTIQEGEPLAPVDVSARTYTAQVRATADATTVTATFSVDMTDAATGIIVLRLADTVTDDLGGSYVWDLQQDTAGVIRTLVGGSFVVVDDVTRAA